MISIIGPSHPGPIIVSNQIVSALHADPRLGVEFYWENLDESRLLAVSTVLSRQPTFWEEYSRTVFLGLFALVSLSLMTIYLLYERKQLHAARNEQMRLSGMLIGAQEDERARLASELHDDFSQRLAVLSLGLETVAEGIPE